MGMGNISIFLLIVVAIILLYFGAKSLFDKEFVKKINGNFVTQYILSFRLIAVGIVILLILYAIFFEIR